MPSVHPLHIAVSNEVIDDLRERLARTRWPDEIVGSAWDYGTELAYLQDLVIYWRDEYDWRVHERGLNELAHFRAEVGGLAIHFVHERGRGPDPLPLLLTHGWPSSFLEMLKILSLLTDPAAHGGDPDDSFDVVVPSLPGFGFSERPRVPGIASARTAELWAELMTDVLGYSRFAAHGGDIGSGVTTRLGQLFPERLAAIHLTTQVADAYVGAGAAPLTAAEREFLERLDAWEESEGGYSAIQRTKPQTLAFSLNDSPAGLAAWIVEKFRAWSDCGGDVESRFTRDELLTNLTLYWVTETAGSAARMYFEARRHSRPLGLGDRVKVPTGVTLFPNEFAPETPPPREWVERSYDLRHYRTMPHGGHFPALEEPEALVDELRAFFRPFRHDR